MSSDSTGKPSADHPKSDPSHVIKGIVSRGLKPVSNKELISLRIDRT